MQRWDFHTHSTWCDGKNTVQEMTDAAYALGFSGLGFSGHGYCPVSQEYCMTPEREAFYRQDVLAQRERYQGRMRIFLGLELEAQDTRIFPPGMYDYLIGSLHYIEEGGVAYPMDDSVETLGRCIREGFGGDAYRLAEAFFARSAMAICARRPDIVGHFDLLARYNGQGRFLTKTARAIRGSRLKQCAKRLRLGRSLRSTQARWRAASRTASTPRVFCCARFTAWAARWCCLRMRTGRNTSPLLSRKWRRCCARRVLTEHGWEERPLGG